MNHLFENTLHRTTTALAITASLTLLQLPAFAQTNEAENQTHQTETAQHPEGSDTEISFNRHTTESTNPESDEATTMPRLTEVAVDINDWLDNQLSESSPRFEWYHPGNITGDNTCLRPEQMNLFCIVF